MLRLDLTSPGWTDLNGALLRQGWFQGKSRLEEALLPLLNALEWRGDTRQLTDALPGKDGDFGLKELRGVMATLGYTSVERKGSLRGIGSAGLPCLFLPGGKTEAPLVLLERIKDGLVAFHAGEGQARIVDNDRIWGHYVRFEPMEPAEEAAPGESWFITLVRRFQPIFREVLWLGPAINAFALVVPFFIMLVYDRVIGAHSIDALPYLLAGAGIALVAESLFRLIRSLLLAKFGSRLSHLVSCSVFGRLMDLEPAVAEQASPAGQIARIKTFESVREFFTGQTFVMFIELPFLVVIEIALFLLSPGMAGVCLGVAVLFCLLIFLQIRHLRTSSRTSARTLAERQAAALEIFSKLPALRVNGLVEALLSRFDRVSLRAARASARFDFAMHMLEHMAAAIGVLGGLVAISFGLAEVWAGTLTPGGLIAGMILVWRILGPIQQLIAAVPRLEQVSSAIRQIDRLMSIQPENTAAMESYHRHSFKGQVDLVNVTMRYGRGDPVFSNLTLAVPRGNLVAITGGNGSGKSTLLKLLNGMYRQSSGSIRIDGIDIRQLNALALRRCVTYIPQTANLFSGTIRENLVAAVPLASDDAIREVLGLFDALEEVENLPKGLDTIIGAEGVSLPETLSFKLVLARAFIDPQPIILCDEMPHSLMAGTVGERFRTLIAQMKGKHTIFVITHTQNFINIADQVVLLAQERRHAIGVPNKIMPLLKEPLHARTA